MMTTSKEWLEFGLIQNLDRIIIIFREVTR